MLDDSLIIGLIVLLICGAACFYLYMRISFVERKLTMIDAVLMDIKMAMDSIMGHNCAKPSPVPIAPTPPPEPIPEESFYSSVLEQAHEESEKDSEKESPDESPEESRETPMEESLDAPEAENLDTMTKNELISLAEKRGLRAKRSSSRNEVIALLRRSPPAQNDAMKAGAENVSGSTGAGASLDGTVNVDLGQGTKLE